MFRPTGSSSTKCDGNWDGVNITVGLKGGIIRISVDHGTAFDIAGKNIAAEESMLAAIHSAIELAPKKIEVKIKTARQDISLRIYLSSWLFYLEWYSSYMPILFR